MKTKLALLALFISTSSLAVTLNTSDGPITLDESTGWSAAPTVIVAHGCAGFDVPAHARQWVRDIRSWGYNAVLVDSFTARGYPKGVCGMTPVRPTVRSRDMDAVADYIRSQSWHKGKIAMIGFSHGGATALNVSSNPSTKIDAAVAYYPNCFWSFVGRDYARATIPTQVHLAQDDTWTPPGACQSTFTNQQAHLYPNTGHAFDINLPDRVISGYLLKYNNEAYQLSRTRTQQFLQQHIGQ